MSLRLASSRLSSHSLLSASLVPSLLCPELTACGSALRRVHRVLRVIKARALFSGLVSLDPSLASTPVRHFWLLENHSLLAFLSPSLNDPFQIHSLAPSWLLDPLNFDQHFRLA